MTVRSLWQGLLCRRLLCLTILQILQSPSDAVGLNRTKLYEAKLLSFFTRLAFTSMISRFEVHLQGLLLQRRVLEHLKGPGKKMDGSNFWRILTQVQKESKSGPVKMCDGLVVSQPSLALKEKMEWLDGLYRVRNCLAHRLGKVQIIDVKPSGVPLEETKDTDTLNAVWLRIRVSVNGEEIQLPYTATKMTEGNISFEKYCREWKIGEQIDVNPSDCQAIAMSLSMLGQHLQVDFENEMNVVFGI
jgi:hypothetical protein